MARIADWACEGASALGAMSAAKLHDEIVEIGERGLGSRSALRLFAIVEPKTKYGSVEARIL